MPNESYVKKAFVLVGGEGTRLRPLTYEKPKSLFPIQGKPMAEHILDLLKKYGVDDVVLSIGYLGDMIKDYFGDGSKFGIKITYVDEGMEKLGTAGPLNLARNNLPEDRFLMMNGDVLSDIDLKDLMSAHIKNTENGALATIVLTPVEDPSRYGVAKIKGDKIIKFIEKPDKGKAPSNLINAGVYVFENDVLDYIPDRRESIMIEREVFPKLAGEGKLFAYEFKGQWFDIGTHEAYEMVKKEWKGVE
ncbi:MAG: hypothetical protein A7316_08730 [Candidatus Altiarchaeales archaeon WOR_SM1_86-2]|nr:MAG: hypothetical protein A7316_08730 [Candidatus Altiarchaeales archaeon WOR_SM1_86-2]